MKKIKFVVYEIFVALTLALATIGCIDDDNDGSGVSFNGIATTVEEDDGTITIPLRDGSVSEGDIAFGGSATEGEDYTLVGVTDEGIQISLTDDSNYEAIETIRIQIPSSGNSIHTVSVLCDGDDTGGWAVADFAGVWHALEDYTSSDNGTFGPYNVTFVQDAENANRFNFTNFYGTAARAAYVVFDVAAGTVSFPDQTPTNPGSVGVITASSGTFDLCEKTLTIDLNYDGLDWVYRFDRN